MKREGAHIAWSPPACHAVILLPGSVCWYFFATGRTRPRRGTLTRPMRCSSLCLCACVIHLSLPPSLVRFRRFSLARATVRSFVRSVFLRTDDVDVVPPDPPAQLQGPPGGRGEGQRQGPGPKRPPVLRPALRRRCGRCAVRLVDFSGGHARSGYRFGQGRDLSPLVGKACVRHGVGYGFSYV